jgi:DNA-binding response OmpR family regulator
MALIVLIEDDPATRMLVSSMLRKDGHEVVMAENGGQGLLMVKSRRPDLVISDVRMPLMDGFEMLAALRLEPAIATVPVVLLTSLQERDHMRTGMTAGADDYITKPFTPAELREAVAAQLNKRQLQASLHAVAIDAAVDTALARQRQNLARLYERRLAHELSRRWPSPQDAPGDEHFDSATALFVDMASYAEVAQKLSPDELADLVKRFYGAANDTVHLFGARHMHFVGEGLLAVFADASDTRTVNHALRAARTALGLVESAHALRNHLETAYPGRGLPAFRVHVALHTGPVTLTLLQDPLHGTAQLLPVGEVVNATMRLQEQAQVLDWPVAMGVHTLRMVTGAMRTGRSARVHLPGRTEPLEAVELTGAQG